MRKSRVSGSQVRCVRISSTPDRPDGLGLLTSPLVVFELPDDAQRWTAAERELALQVLHGQTVVVNVRRGGPHHHLVPWLRDHGMISYVGHPGSRHSWPRSDFANPFVKQAGADRETMVRRYRAWLDDQRLSGTAHSSVTRLAQRGAGGCSSHSSRRAVAPDVM